MIGRRNVAELAGVTERIVKEAEGAPELQNLLTSFRPYAPRSASTSTGQG